MLRADQKERRFGRLRGTEPGPLLFGVAPRSGAPPLRVVLEGVTSRRAYKPGEAHQAGHDSASLRSVPSGKVFQVKEWLPVCAHDWPPKQMCAAPRNAIDTGPRLWLQGPVCNLLHQGAAVAWLAAPCGRRIPRVTFRTAKKLRERVGALVAGSPIDLGPVNCYHRCHCG